MVSRSCIQNDGVVSIQSKSAVQCSKPPIVFEHMCMKTCSLVVELTTDHCFAQSTSSGFPTTHPICVPNISWAEYWSSYYAVFVLVVY
jgi:hypothetical protein